MKIRNKQTGDVWDMPKMRHPTVQEDDISFFAVRDGDGKLFSYPSIAELNADWEDYTPKEPLIKDEKIRKAVRAWADAVGGSPVCFYEDTGYEGVGRLKIYREGYPAVFDLGHQFYDLELDTQYTIAELCGEEE